MVNDLISDAMMDAHNIAIRREQVDLVTMLGEIVNANRALAEKKNQTLQLIAPAHQLWSCDPDRLREAVDNLISNAIKYSPVGGHIELTMSVADEHVLIRVADEGAGPVRGGRVAAVRPLSAAVGAADRRARPRPGSAFPSSSASSSCTAALSARRAAGPGRGTTFTIRLPAAAAARRPP